MLLFNLQETQPFGNLKRHGGGKSGEAVFKRIIERGYDVCAIYDSKRWFNPEIQKLVIEHGVNLYDSNDISIYDVIKNNNIQKYFTPLVNSRSIEDFPCEIYGQIHGLRQLELPNDYYQLFYKPNRNILHYIKMLFWGDFYKNNEKFFFNKLFTKKNFHPIVVSNHTASAIKVFYPQMIHATIPVFYTPPAYERAENQECKKGAKYFLIVSASISYKNALRAIKGLDRLFSMGILNGYQVKITGASSADIFRYKIKNSNYFEFLGYVDDSELALLYRDAYCLIYPSLNEGFGLPPLEAMQYGVPVLLSAITSTPEVVGYGGVYFNPFSIEEIMNRIVFILGKKNHEKMSELAKKRFDEIYEIQCRDLDRMIDYIYVT